MPWIVGIDEAGYGPNLGPFVMTAAARRVERTPADLWKLLATWVRRAGEPADKRWLVADSKLVYSPQTGLCELERSVLALTQKVDTFRNYLESFFPRAIDEIHAEAWFTGATPLPHANGLDDLSTPSDELGGFEVQGVAVCPRRFNQLADEQNSKGAVLAHSLVTLLQCFREVGDLEEPLFFFIDKHGGRNTYAAMLQHAFPDGLVVTQEEGRERSIYNVIGLDRAVRVTFQPRADSEHFCVALASMVSKYVRELFMGEFNTFWQHHLPDLKPTAGYPLDAKRYLDAIWPVAERLGIPMDCLWRRR